MVRIRRIAWPLALAFVFACGNDEPDLSPHDRAVATVTDALASDHEWLRAETVRLIGELGTADFTGELQAALHDPSPLVQTAAVEVLLRRDLRSAEESAMAQLVSGPPAQRARLLELVVHTGRAEFRTDVLLRALRDTDRSVQIAALRHAIATNTHFGIDEFQRLMNDEDATVSAEAFLALMHFERLAALDLVLTMLRSSTQAERDRGLRFARHLNSANLWPMMRALATQTENPETRQLALMVLGHLGDQTVEEDLRVLVLSARDHVAADALRAISHIDTPRARDQPLIHRRDSRPAVREAALEALTAQRRPADDFGEFLHDQRADIADGALLHMQQSDPERAAALYAHTLRETDDPAAVLYALYRVSLANDIRRFLDASSTQLQAVLAESDMNTAGLAARLLLTATPPSELEERIRNADSPDALYALIEATYGADGDFSDLYTEALDNDLVAIQVAAALGVVALGDAYHPPIGEAEAQAAQPE